MTAAQTVPVEIDAELLLVEGMQVFRGDRVLDDAGQAHELERAVLWPGEVRLFGVDGWVEVVGVEQIVAVVTRPVSSSGVAA